MDDTPFDFVSLAVEVMVALAVIGFISYALFIGSSMTRSYQRETDAANTMAEYALYSKYDGTQLTGSDAVEAIYSYAEDGFTVTFLGTAYTTAPMNLVTTISAANLTRQFQATLVIDASGRVAGITFN